MSFSDRRRSTTLSVYILLTLGVTSSHGGCQFPEKWTGGWFQNGVPHPLHINLTHIETRGECYEEQGGDKFLVHDKSENCYRCMAIHEKHQSVIQYKESYCDVKASLQELCDAITGDAPLYSMFRKYPEAKPVPCPFKSAPFTFSYNRGFGDCVNPPSMAESCTDDSRLVLKYQACPDVTATESNAEELVCLAVWKEGSTRYLVGRISQGNRRATSDEDQYRCFIYQRDVEGSRVVYNIAQSGDATCTGLQNAFEGSRTMKFTTVDNHHNRCRFPSWITDHHTWLSLDHKKTFKFSQKNATLKIVDEDPKPSKLHQNYPPHFAFREFGIESQEQRKQNSEMRLVCHSILESMEQKKVQIVAHITHGCDSGYVCMVFYKRDSNVIEIQQSDREENPDDACRNFDPIDVPYTTLITTTLHPKKCPHLGRYTVTTGIGLAAEKRKKRQQPGLESVQSPGQMECLSYEYEALAIGCGGSHELMEFKTPCVQQPISGYTCHGSWQENNTFFVITSPVARKSTDALRYCFIYSMSVANQGGVAEGALAKNTGPPVLRLSGVSGSCNRDIVPGTRGNWAFNFTGNGTCAETDLNRSSTYMMTSIPALVLTALFAFVILR